jgi:hypothetical protein
MATKLFFVKLFPDVLHLIAVLQHCPQLLAGVNPTKLFVFALEDGTK